MPLAGSLRTTPAAELLQELRLIIDPKGGPVDAHTLLQILEEWERRKAAEEVTTEVQRMQLEQAQEVQFKLIAVMLEKGTAYTNLVILAGYAAFFALMPFVKDLLTPGLRKGAILLMLASIATFVGFEMYKMLVTQFAILGRLSKFNTEIADPASDRVAAAAQFQRDMNRHQASNLYAWKFSITVTVMTGFFALAILAIALASNPTSV